MEQLLLKTLSNILEVPVSELNIESSAANVEKWDSLKHMSVIFAVEDAFNITIPDDKLATSTSVKTLLSIITQEK